MAHDQGQESASQFNLKYLNNERLPASAPVGHSHILDWPNRVPKYTSLPSIRLCDAIATVLFKFDKNVFDAFFDDKISTFLYIHSENHPRANYNYAIYRNGNEITVSLTSPS